MAGISILIQAFNEEKNIRHALESCMWADEVIVIDNFSTDDTARIVSEFPNARLIQRSFDGYATQKNWALDTVEWKNEWIFILDADESIPCELQSELRQLIDVPQRHSAYFVNRKIIFLGKWIRFGGWYPSWNVRLLKAGLARYEDRAVHEHMIVRGLTGYLKNDLLHHDRKDFSVWLNRHNVFSSLEAREIFQYMVNDKHTGFSQAIDSPLSRKRFLKERVLYRLPFRPFIWFIYLYIFKFGFLDGLTGLVYSCLYATQQLHTDIKLKELTTTPIGGKKKIEDFWNASPCGIKNCPYPENTPQFYEFTERWRDEKEPFIATYANFDEMHGKKMLEIGCGIGVDTMKFARAGADVTAIDLSSRSIEVTRARLEHHSLKAELLRADAESLPFPDAYFDHIYSWGVLHHTPDTEKALSEAIRVLKKGGTYCFMLYNRHSLLGLQLYIRYALPRLHLFKSMDQLFSQHLESPGTKAYSFPQLKKLCALLPQTCIRTQVTPYDMRMGRRFFLPPSIQKAVPSFLGFFHIISGEK